MKMARFHLNSVRAGTVTATEATDH